MDTKKIDNVKFDNENKAEEDQVLGPDGKPFNSYCELFCFACLQPEEGSRGLAPKESYEAFKLVDKLEKQKDADKLEVSAAEFEKIKKSFNGLKSGASREIAELYEILESI